MTPNKYEAAKKRKENMRTWFPEYVESTFSKRSMYHHLERHINNTDEQMMRRASRERLSVSTFIGEEADVVDLLKNTLIECIDEVMEYLTFDDDDPYEIHGTLTNKVKGFIYEFSGSHEWKNGPKECKEFTIILKKRKNENGFAILSAYPIVSPC